MRNSTSIDWSGDPGDPNKKGASRWLVIAAVHINLDLLEHVGAVLDALRRERKLREGYFFKFKNSTDHIKEAFFASLEHAPITATVLTVDKFALPEEWFSKTRGNDRIIRLISHLICQLPDELIAGHLITVDLSPSEAAILLKLRQSIRDTLTAASRSTPRKIRALQDDRGNGFPIQIADMIAGLLHSELEMRNAQAGTKWLRGKLTILKY